MTKFVLYLLSGFFAGAVAWATYNKVPATPSERMFVMAFYSLYLLILANGLKDDKNKKEV